MIKTFQRWREKRRVMKGLSILRSELEKGFSKKRYYTEGQVINMGVKLGLDVATIEYAVAFFVEPQDVVRVLEKMGSSKTTNEIAKNMCLWYGVPSLLPEGYQGSLSEAISDFYDVNISFDVPTVSSSLGGGFDGGFSDSGGGDGSSD